ncbi:acetyl-CoA carboxylase biotin carboxylase subunit [Subsaximicrobium wynnwilliamsii]|uniref:Acetyl-CoA carboxylase biotin carboxylase subunit n=1 Tax=Subsaximicrobium wynnwilliamsii TaxID=291179 RepID=A0A5C6ZN35_9FLAO|nr:acetyl-CoA carboxylase biotin carboxylase subunit [Subsaximicrobium wynnwilliamsii]TXD84723.1 acetyl-CoA carboxylase biotin carboxylase subunit [Subsaximicrobium wynnwilliamsii]TXD90393.1 acetyl-CoA carboxylase biotin carboxylase subunit [Subsaximicrobium wynnwilliamsii]TXE04869.1 acetyl-CoA carboxylase biotin carboxylase subunit [Subsaximicrobium wynnwilliamsii]
MKKILIANRGEIAIRVMRTAKKMGIKTVAVYSTVDRNAPHVKFADEAVLIGEAPSNKSYLLGDKIIEVAKALNVDAIHPGYGFLSENAQFAEACEANDIVFIGPKSKAIKIMGSKLAAKDAVKAYDIPMVPGTDEAIDDIPEAKKIAEKIGFPILIKASAGGGGKGMRIVENASEFESQMDRAISEAKNAFGDGSVFIEKYVASPRHIEIQVMADTHGNIIHLFERECSIQRRHQKVIEEAPSCVLTPALREEMGQAAIKVAKACDYVGAGTVEFLLDENHNFYFLEMNTRLQVEHPVTEWITNTDLVELQIRVARGEELPLKQSDLKIEGHALELRVYAEDPLNDFLPSVGNLKTYKLPVGEGIRVDNGFEQGMDIPIYYDPMLAKLVTYGKTREEAIGIMLQAIAAYEIEGIETTLPFGSFVCEHEAFRSGNFDTHFVKNHFSAEKIKAQQEAEANIAALVAVKAYLKEQRLLKTPE